jgi:hypothetical protein
VSKDRSPVTCSGRPLPDARDDTRAGNSGRRRWRRITVGAAGVGLLLALTVPGIPVSGVEVASASIRPYLAGLETVATVASTIPPNGDENPYAVYVAPYTAGRIDAGDLLVDDFNSVDNDQGTGTTVVLVRPNGATTVFASVPRHLRGCPGGVGLTTAMAMLRGGWVLVGSAPTAAGTTATAGHGCLVVLDATGGVVGTLAGPEIDGPWDMTTTEDGSSATLLVTNTLIGVHTPGQSTVAEGDLVRLRLRVSSSAPPVLESSTVIADGFPERSDVESRLVVGPTGVVLDSGTAYVANPLDNDVVAVPDALTRTTPARVGMVLSSGGALRGPLAMALAPNGDVEITPAGRQVAHVTVDPDPAQSPPGDGDLFGLAVVPGRGVYFAKDDTNTLALLH